jgi:RNA polymerase sigma-70 factor (ECF subfamily)
VYGDSVINVFMNVYTHLDDVDLLKHIVLGNEYAFTEIYNRYWEVLFAMAYKRLRDVQSAEDVVHDVLVSLWHNREKASITNLKAYLATAVKYTIFAHFKREQRDYAYQQVTHMNSPEDNIDLETSLHYKRILDLLKDEVENLPEKCRLIFKYSREDHMTVKDIAQMLSLSPSTIENQLNKAIGRLRNTLKNISTPLLLIFLSSFD